MSNGHATKIFIPADSTALLGAVGGIKELLATLDGRASGSRRRADGG